MTDNLFFICEPRPDVLQGALRESDFAADLSQVLRGDAPDEYKRPELFFANTYPTKGIKNVLKLVALRVGGHPDQIGAIFRLDTQFGGGKTHALIALAHAMRSLSEVANADEFLDASLRPSAPVRIAAFDGETPILPMGTGLATPCVPTRHGGNWLMRCVVWTVIAWSKRVTAKESHRVPTPCAS